MTFISAATASPSLDLLSPSLQPRNFADLAATRAPVSEGVSRMLAAVPTPDGGSAAPGGTRELVASEDSANAGGVRGAYDLELYREPDGSYTLEVNMKIEFDFTDGDNGLQWTADEKTQFMADYNQAIQDAWGGHTITTDDGQQVRLDVNLDLSEERSGFFGGVRDMVDPSEHWNVEVKRIPEGDFSQSYVTPGLNTGNFDSEDVKPTEKGASDPQVGAAHEFGHMLGLPDEYNGGPNISDKDSLMHTGADVRERHLDILESWVEGEL